MISSIVRSVPPACVLAALLVCGGDARAQLVINEVSYNPLGDDATVQLEFIELHNRGAAAVDLAGHRLVFGAEPFVFPAGSSIPPGGYVVVAESKSALLAATGVSTPYEWAGLVTGLSNGGEPIDLLAPGSSLLDHVAYDDDPPWPTAADGNGPTLELVNPALDNALASSWLASSSTHGTPGTQNGVFTGAPTVVSETPRRLSSVADMPAVSVVFSRPVSGVTAADLTVDGSPATALACASCSAGVGSGPYEFSGFAAPAPGSAAVVLSAGAIQSDGVPFGGEAWTVSTGITVVLNEIHYHPPDATADAEFLEIQNVGPDAVDAGGWRVSDGLNMTFPSGTTIAPGGFLVIALDPVLLQATTGFAGALGWGSGRLDNGGERLALSDASGNELDVVDFGDGGTWPFTPDGDGPSLELVSSTLDNGVGEAWRASAGLHGTPGATNSVDDPTPPPVVSRTAHTPPIPAPFASVTVTAFVFDDSLTPSVTLYWRQDADPTLAYSSTPMFDDGLHGDGTAGDRVYGATVPGLGEGARMDFTIRADDGTGVGAAPAGHDTLAAGGYPAQTYLLKFSAAALPTDFPSYHLVTTQRTRTLQAAHDETEHDATFLRCTAPATCDVFYNVTERYRGSSSLGQHPHSFRINLPGDRALDSELGFPVTRMNLMAQSTAKQSLGYQFFRLAFDGSIPTPRTQFVRLNTNPLSHGGTQDWVYINVERVDDDFLESQGGSIVPLRFPDRCSEAGVTCETNADCPPGESCVRTDSGNLYRGRHPDATLQYLGPSPESGYRTAAYEKETNVEADLWDDLIDQCFAIDADTTPDASFEASMRTTADEVEWARWFAIHMLLVNQEGGIYRDTGDDYFIYFEPPGSPNGPNATMLTWDQDSVFGGFGDVFDQETIWRTTVVNPQRFLRSNAFAGLFAGAICELMDTDFQQAVMDARIDALPAAVADATRKQNLKNWVAARRTFVAGELQRTLTLTGVPPSPYSSPDPVVTLSGRLNQCGTREVQVNGVVAGTYSVQAATWSHAYTLSPGNNTITVQDVDHLGTVIDSVTQSVFYAPPGAPDTLRLSAPARMINDRTLTLKAEILDPLGGIEWRGWEELGTVTATRVSDGSAVPITVTVFDTHVAVPAGSIRFYNGVGSVSLTLDQGASFPPGDVRISVSVRGLSASAVVTVVGSPAFRPMAGTLSGASLTWGPDEFIRVTGDITVPSGATLTIRPGTLVMVDTTGSLNDGTLITVNGAVNATGTASAPIHFFSSSGPAAMVLTQSGSPSNASAWRGIHHFGGGSSVYRHVVLTGAGNGVVVSHPRPPILGFNNTHSVLVEDSVFVDNNGMVFAGAGTGSYTVRRTLVSRCGIGAEFNGNGHTLLIEDTWWTSCGWAPESANLDGDLLHVDGSASNQTIRRSIFADGGDDGIDHNGSSFSIENFIVYRILDKAVSMTGGHMTGINGLIFETGSAIRGTASVQNVTIASGNILSPDSIQESILWTGSNPTCPESENVDYSIVGNPADLGCGTGNLSVNPQFRNPGQRDYNPAPGSPALTAGPAGERIGWLGFPEATTCLQDADCTDGNACTLDSCGDAGVCEFEAVAGCQPCTLTAECDDGDPCTTDSCNAGTCAQMPAPDGTVCDDGSLCTSADACAAGACTGAPVSCSDGDACTTDTCEPLLGCLSTGILCDDGVACTADSCDSGTGCLFVSTCPSGQTCSPSGVCTTEATLSFQEGVGGYAGTQDTYLAEGLPTTPNGGVDNWRWDTANAGGQEFGLLRFDGLFGSGPGQIPAGAQIESATLQLVVFNASVAPAGAINEALVDWNEGTVTWASFGGDAGVQSDEFGAFVASAPIAAGPVVADVTASLQAWSTDPAANRGWIFRPSSNDGVQVRSAEYAAAIAERPRLTVTYSVPASCTGNTECDDGNACNGAETCSGGLCQPGTPPVCDDGNPCTTDSCDQVLGCRQVNNTDPCTDGNACTTGDVCSAGACQPGGPLTCDDGLACTSDSCDGAGGCLYVDACPSGELCNPGTGTCQSAPQTATFQHGVSGYLGALDTFLHAGLPAADNGAATTLIVDGVPAAGDERQVLLRFDGLFQPQGGPIPAGAQILAATLELRITNGSLDGAELHRMLAPWLPSSTWNSMGAGVQRDGVESLAAADVTSAYNAPIPATHPIDVTTSVAAWSAGATNLGWLFVTPAGLSDSWQFDSSEVTTLANRPKLTVQYQAPATSCSTDPECDDGLFCNGQEVCVAGACQGGIAPVCDDGAACSTDTCNEATDSCESSPCTMQVVASGARSLSITPPAGEPSVALRVSSPSVACLPLYVAADGTLGSAPVFRSSADWGTVLVRAAQIVPATAFDVQAEVVAGSPVATASDTTWRWGDVNDDGRVDVFDVLCALDGTLGVFTKCTLAATDLRGEVPDGVVDDQDVTAVLDAFGGLPYPDDPCQETGR